MSIISQSKSSVGEPEGTAVSPNDMQAGYDGHEAKFTSYPATTDKGSLSIQAVDNAGDFHHNIKNKSCAQASNFNIPDPGQSETDFVLNNEYLAAGTSAGSAGDADNCAAQMVIKTSIGGATVYIPVFTQNT
jgi:hypothetical protein